jgi:hypothetical protein
MSHRRGKALAYAILIWVIGFVWGSVVFMTPALKKVSPIPYISSNPAISFPILILWILVAYLLSTSYLRGLDNRAAEGLKLGIIFSATNIFLDLVVIVIALRAGFGYFVSLTVWLGYFILLVMPAIVARQR